MTDVGTCEPIARRNVGEIAANVAGATEIFRRYGIDFCCHGDVTLEVAAEAKRLDGELIGRELAALEAKAPLAALPESTDDLIDHILTRYHEIHRREMPELIRLSRKVEDVHAGKPGVPSGLADLLQEALGELEVHMRKEELILFPAMRQHSNGLLTGPITQMRHDHVDHGEMLERMIELTENFTVPEGGCGTWRALYVGAEKLRNDLIDHIHLENNILFPRFEEARNAL